MSFNNTGGTNNLFATPSGTGSPFAGFGQKTEEKKEGGQDKPAATFGNPSSGSLFGNTTGSGSAFGGGAFGGFKTSTPSSGANTPGGTTASASGGTGSNLFGGSSLSTPAFGATTEKKDGLAGQTTSGGSLFGQPSEKKEPGKSLFGTGGTAFGTTSGTAPSFGAASSSTPAFGTTSSSTATPSFGATSTATPSFGATSTAIPSFGAAATTSTATPSFGIPSTTTPSFGASTSTATSTSTTTSTSAPSFGVTSTPTVPSLGATSSTPTFGASGTSGGTATSSFGANSATGATNSATPSFGATYTATPLFGATSTATPSFGTTSTATPSFGGEKTTSTPPFGTSTATSTATPSFGAATATTKPGGFSFGKAEEKKDEVKPNIENKEESKPAPLSFGGFSTSSTAKPATTEPSETPSLFGKPAVPTASLFGGGEKKPTTEEKPLGTPSTIPVSLTGTIAKKPESSAASAPAGPTVATTTATSNEPKISLLRGKTLDSIINDWTRQLEEQRSHFLSTAGDVRSYDRILREANEKVGGLIQEVGPLQKTQEVIVASLDFIEQQQADLSSVLDELEKDVLSKSSTQSSGSLSQQERDRSYTLASDLTNSLNHTAATLATLVSEINTSGEDVSENSSLFTEITTILNSHLSTLRYIERKTVQLRGDISQMQKEVEGVVL